MKFSLMFTKLIMALVVLSALACKELPQYDLVILNAKYFTNDSSKFVLTNIGVKNGKIAILSTEELAGVEFINAENAFVYPGFIDAHCHFYGYAEGLLSVNLIGTKSEQEVYDRIKDFYERNPEVLFLKGRGWDQNDWPDKTFPTNAELNERFPSLPVILERVDGHALWVNDAALYASGIIPEFISGGEIVRINGSPTGILIDAAAGIVSNYNYSKQEIISALKRAEQNCYSLGLTGLADAGLPFSAIELLDSLLVSETLEIPLYIMHAYSIDDVEHRPWKSNRLKVRSIKVYSDGALGSRGALLLEEYADQPMHFGLPLTSRDEFKKICQDAKKSGQQVNVHAIGDSANRMVLHVFAEVLGGKNDLRWRVEHAQIINPADSVFFQKYSILPSVQPTHATSDMYWAESRLGSERINHAYSYADLYRWSGGHMPLGTDFPVEDIDPRKTFYAAVTRQDSNLYPEGGFLPSQKLNRIQTLKGMTIEAAYAQFEETETGSIEVGKWANFFLSPVNLLECSSTEILKAPITRTIVRGKTVFKLENTPKK